MTKQAPKFVYFSTCCKATATKEPCARTPGQKEWEQLPLGTWNCSKCSKPCTVTRQNNE